jgi:hypothetical protein
MRCLSVLGRRRPFEFGRGETDGRESLDELVHFHKTDITSSIAEALQRVVREGIVVGIDQCLDREFLNVEEKTEQRGEGLVDLSGIVSNHERAQGWRVGRNCIH